MKWSCVKLGTVIKLYHGKATSYTNDISEKYPVYGANGIVGYNNKSLFSDAIIFGRVGAYCGSVNYCQSQFWATDNTIIGKVDDKHNQLFIFNQLRNIPINQFCNGSAQPLITNKILNDICILLPSRQIQDKIANILTRYDDLIENNRRRIAILEEMAMRTYQEWFVHFRFPGHEATEFINGLPAGWEDGVLGQLAKFKRGKNITIAEAIEGEYPVVAGGINPSCYHNDYNAIAPVVTVSASGANAGFTRLYQTNVWAADCSFIDKKCPNIYFVYCFLKLYSAITENLQRGSAQPHVHAKDLNAIKLVIPAQETIKKFNSFVKALFDEIHLIETQNTKLQNMRDRLLPQLMSGQLEVTPNDEAL